MMMHKFSSLISIASNENKVKESLLFIPDSLSPTLLLSKYIFHRISKFHRIFDKT